jgi:imidazolonepropionase-like amidohydrolase
MGIWHVRIVPDSDGDWQVGTGFFNTSDPPTLPGDVLRPCSAYIAAFLATAGATMPTRRLPLVLALLAAIPMASAQDAAPATNAPAISVVHCGHLFDSESGRMLGQTTITVEGDRIKSVNAGAPQAGMMRTGMSLIELGNATCLPGLIDSHVHLTMQTSPTQYSDQFRWNPADYAIRSTVYAQRTLMAGFTTVRNVADNDYDSVALRNAINAGIVPGPRIFTAGTAIGSTGGHADDTDGYRRNLEGDHGANEGMVNSPADAWKAVRQHYKEGVDLIKIMPSGGVLDESASVDNAQMTIEEITAVVSAAHDYGFTVAAHAHGAEAIRRAVIGGVDSIEHGSFMDDADMKLMKEHGTWYVPTIIAGKYVEEKAAIPGYYPAQIAVKARMIGPIIQTTAGKAYRAGVKIAFGTDAAVFPHGQNAKEFEYMVQAGMPPAFTLQAATTHAAQLLKHDKDVGSVSAGKFADIVAVPGDPLADIKLMMKVDFVMKAGVVYKRNGMPVEPLAQAITEPTKAQGEALEGY